MARVKFFKDEGYLMVENVVEIEVNPAFMFGEGASIKDLEDRVDLFGIFRDGAVGPDEDVIGNVALLTLACGSKVGIFTEHMAYVNYNSEDDGDNFKITPKRQAKNDENSEVSTRVNLPGEVGPDDLIIRHFDSDPEIDPPSPIDAFPKKSPEGQDEAAKAELIKAAMEHEEKRVRPNIMEVLGDGDPQHKVQCPNCQTWSLLTDDMYHGRVAVRCINGGDDAASESCGFEHQEDFSMRQAQDPA